MKSRETFAKLKATDDFLKPKKTVYMFNPAWNTDIIVWKQNRRRKM